MDVGTPGRRGNPLRWGYLPAHISPHFLFDHIYVIGGVTK